MTPILKTKLKGMVAIIILAAMLTNMEKVIPKSFLDQNSVLFTIVKIGMIVLMLGIAYSLLKTTTKKDGEE